MSYCSFISFSPKRVLCVSRIVMHGHSTVCAYYMTYLLLIGYYDRERITVLFVQVT